MGTFFRSSFLPDEWTVDVIVVRAGGRDSRGNPIAGQEIPLSDCQITPRSTSEPVDRSDLVDSSAVLIRDGFTFLHTDRIRVPAGQLMAGEWSIEGRPGEWPGSSEVALKRA
ncbi:hypothetical protein [Pseudarthrobacter polychromogenes]|uniref:Head-to-tail stopper n=1 Tax=Pseudarthrobacter polychromogenes TaxID=1676 RepID=A0ABQ1Y2R2_9MICC|nr:hypothetical protein [Pseudarthrobacter polychromogenes]GGH10417.1 hypothetical protein GCM10011577_39220 [Pseudarthrobacter polychromogenes]